ncbi:MAG: response regulator [Alphaproteobacteria bacterium]|nr:response regulator [Alphaproteobacteria bacterium]
MTGMVLIVDDVPANIQVLHAAIGGLATTRFATSGAQALTVAAREPPDLVLHDVVMPGLDGFEVCRRLKADPATAAALVVLVSGSGDDETIERGLDAGADDFLVKPAPPALIRRRVELMLELAARRRA